MLDEIYPNIKFTKDTSEQELPFLDVLVKERNTRITTNIYYKVTDTHYYLHFGSCHPHPNKTSIRYNLARRICTIVSEKDTRDIRLNELKTYLFIKKKAVAQSVRAFASHAECGRLGIRIPVEKYLSRKNQQRQLHCLLLCNKCGCHRSQLMTQLVLHA